MRWFRFYAETLHKPKVRRLPASLFRNWVLILCIASESKPRGVLPPTKDIAYHLGCSEGLALNIVDELRNRGLIDEVDGALRPHNWDERQPPSDNATERMQNIRRTRSEQVRPREEENRTEENRTEKKRGEGEENIFRLYEQTIGPFDPHMATKLQEAAVEYSWECIQHSFQEASENNARSWRYVETILKSHKASGCYAGRRGESKGSNLEHDELHRRYELAGKPCPFCHVPEDEPEVVEEAEK